MPWIGASTPPIIRWAIAIAATAMALALGFQALTLALARHAMAADEPERALKWRPEHSPALARQAEIAVSDVGERQLRRAITLSEKALAISPLEVSALRTLGLVAARQGRDDRATALMTASAARNLRDPAHLWLFQHRLAERNYEGVLDTLDALMRRRATRLMVGPVLASMAADPAASDAIVKRLARRPVWRGALIEDLARSSDPGLALSIVTRLEDLGSRPTPREAAAVVAGLVKKKRIPEAYLAWVQTLPPEGLAQLADVYDGQFDGLPGSPPFNWALAKATTGVGAKLMRSPDDDRGALYVRYSSARAQELAGQTLLLPAGRYRLSFEATAITGAGAFRWVVSCGRGGKNVLLELAPAADLHVRRQVSGDFTVPQTCQVQRLALRGQPGDEDLSQLWIHQIEVRRLEANG